MDLKAIGNNIKRCRKNMGLTQANLAEKINLSTIHMSHLETGAASMSLECMLNICNALKVTPDELLYGEYELNLKSTSDKLNGLLDSLTADEKKLVIEFTELLRKSKINNKN